MPRLFAAPVTSTNGEPDAMLCAFAENTAAGETTACVEVAETVTGTSEVELGDVPKTKLSPLVPMRITAMAVDAIDVEEKVHILVQ